MKSIGIYLILSGLAGGSAAEAATAIESARVQAAALGAAAALPAQTPRLGAGQAGPVLQDAPDFKFKQDGKESSFKEAYKGKVVLLDFWFVDCPWCLKSTPRLNELHKKYGPQGLVIIGMNVDQEEAERARQYAKDKIQGYAVWYGAQGVAGTYGVAGYPTFILIGPDGKIVSRGGYRELHDADYGSLIESALEKAGKGK